MSQREEEEEDEEDWEATLNSENDKRSSNMPNKHDPRRRIVPMIDMRVKGPLHLRQTERLPQPGSQTDGHGLHPLDPKQSDVGVVPDGRVHVSAGGKNDRSINMEILVDQHRWTDLL